MKRLIVFFIAIALILSTVPVFGAQGRKGASDRALERASDEAIFHRVGDWFATRGKSESEKKAIIAERKAKRAAKRAQKEAEKKKRNLEKEARKAEKKVRKEAKALKKGLGKKK